MIIGVPRERKILEKRVAVTPQGARELVKAGHAVLIETKAGQGSFFSDQEYEAAGAAVVPALEDVWDQAELLVKVKEPDQAEYRFFRPGLAIFDFLHLGGLEEVTREMLAGQVTGIAYELVRTSDGRLPLLEPMSTIAGKLAVQAGSFFLLGQNGGRGVLMSSVGATPAANVVIVGAGIAGQAACGVALGMGANVTVLDIDKHKLAALQKVHGSSFQGLESTPQALEQACAAADLLVGAVLLPGAKAPKVITRKMIQAMPEGAVFVDISIDQGGCSETTRPTSLRNPVFTDEGVLHYAVPNMPAQTARTSTTALTNATLPYIKLLAAEGVLEALRRHSDLAAGLNTHRGQLTNQRVADAWGLPFAEIDNVLK